MTWADEARGPAVGQPLEAPPCCIEARGLRVAFRGAGEILRNVDLCVAPGEHVVVVGPSGCGKTTLLRCLMGEQRAAGGSVATRGRIATVYQDHRLVLQHSALRNVLYGCLGRRSALRTLARFPRDETAEARRLLRSVGLAHREQVAARRLSGGERQRVAIARAMMQRPAIILADEPVASLDRDNAVAIMRLLQELCARRDVALVSVLHDPSVVSAGAARLSYLSGGELHDGPPAAPARTALPPATTGGPTPDATDSKQAHSPPESVVRDPLLPRGAQFAFFALAALGIYGISVATLDIDERQLENVSVGLGRFFRDLLPESPAALLGLPWATLLAALAETAQMSLLGTTAGAAVALPLAVLAAGNTGPRWIVPVMRLLLNAIRTIPSLIWALLFVAAVGFGPLAGVLALAVYSVGYLSKLFYEALEAADPGPQAALRQIGASGAQRFVHAVAPAALPLLLSACMFMLEYNVRAATLLGVVDAGGIGWHIKHFLDYRNFPAALTCLALVLGVVVVLDALSGRVRAWATAR